MVIARQFKVGNLVAGGRFIGATQNLEAEVFAVPFKGVVEIADANSGVEEAGHFAFPSLILNEC